MEKKKKKKKKKKKARRLTVHKHNNKFPGEIQKFYLENVRYTNTLEIRSIKYKKFKFIFKNFIQRLSLKY